MNQKQLAILRIVGKAIEVFLQRGRYRNAEKTKTHKRSRTRTERGVRGENRGWRGGKRTRKKKEATSVGKGSHAIEGRATILGSLVGIPFVAQGSERWCCSLHEANRRGFLSQLGATQIITTAMTVITAAFQKLLLTKSPVSPPLQPPRTAFPPGPPHPLAILMNE